MDFPVFYYALVSLATMVVLAVVNSRIKVDDAAPLDAGPVGMPLYFAHAHRDFLDLGLVRSNADWEARVHAHFGEGHDLVHAGDELRQLGRPGLSLLAAATVGWTHGYGWEPGEIEPMVREQFAALGIAMGFALEDVEEVEGGGYRGRLTVGPWTRELDFQVPGDVYRETNTVIEPEGYRIMQFATADLCHAFALMHLPLARKMFQANLFDLIDPPGGEELVPGGDTQKWYTWLY